MLVSTLLTSAAMLTASLVCATPAELAKRNGAAIHLCDCPDGGLAGGPKGGISIALYCSNDGSSCYTFGESSANVSDDICGGPYTNGLMCNWQGVGRIAQMQDGRQFAFLIDGIAHPNYQVVDRSADLRSESDSSLGTWTGYKDDGTRQFKVTKSDGTRICVSRYYYFKN